MRDCALAIALLGVALLALPVQAQISPGPLSEVHSELEGTLNCLKCHGTRRGSLDEHCMECHKAIHWLMEQNRGLHGRQEEKDCSACHPEHAGSDFELIEWEEGTPERFDHTRTGWTLEGKHRAIKCRDCHKLEFQQGKAADLLEPEMRADSWLGLDTDCRSCHEDPHRDALGNDCRKCHALQSWKPAPLFDHAETSFPLVGKHEPLECSKCHLDPDLPLTLDAEEKPIPIYKPIPHQECSACHEDPHKGKLGAACVSCHAALGWSQVDRNAFDHTRTRFALKGKHAPLKCEVCHDPEKAWGKKPPMDTCGACHRDAHAGKATLAGKAADCAACHDERGFRPATYTVENHDAAPYPLLGKHREVKCEGCHPKDAAQDLAAERGTAGVLLRRSHERCLDCHIDSHGGQNNHRDDNGACESCHGVDGWKPSRYGSAEHAALSLPLEGRHEEAKCSACHGPERPGLPPFPSQLELGKAGVALSLLPSGCDTCHPDPHQGVFLPEGARGKEESCRSCHDLRGFVPSTVDVVLHESYAFPLKGAHRAVPCIDCHEELSRPPSGAKLVVFEGTLRELRFREPHEACTECHETPHGEQFAGRKGGDACESCHVDQGFRPAPLFDHASARFLLEGAHTRVACDKCHPSTATAEGGLQVVYRPLPHECQDCHKGRAFEPGELSRDGEGGAR